MNSSLNNMSMKQVLALVAKTPELHRERLLLEMVMEGIAPYVDANEEGNQKKKRYRMADLINSHRKNTGRTKQ